MSKFLKFLVNTFLIAAILVAAAILIPPIAGVTTTIVDTTAMDTNLPLGSITYSTDVDVSDLKVGDEVLKDNDISTYAYVIKSGDETTGQYQVVSATDPEGREEEIYLRNTVSKVAVVVPYIGYIMIAMHSVEGIIIIALVVILMIILFILSELWRPRDDEDNEEDQEAVVSSGLSGENENGIDTDTIRAAMEANVAAVSAEDAAAEIDESNLSRAERRALKKARKQAEKEEKNAARRVNLDGAAEGGDAVDFQMPTDEEVAAAVASVTAETARNVAKDREVPEELIPQTVIDDAEAPEEAAPEIEQVIVPSELEEDTAASRLEAFAAEAEVELQAAEKSEAKPQAADEESGAPETFDDLAAEMGSGAISEETTPDDRGGFEADGLPVIDESVLNFTEEDETEDAAANVPELERESDIGFAADSPVQDFFEDDDVFGDEPEIRRFTPTKRLTLSEMLDQAKGAGESPEIIEDREVGVTVLDYSDLI